MNHPSVLRFRQDLETQLRQHVREAIETVLEAELTSALGSARHERTERREGYRHGALQRTITTGDGLRELEVPRGRIRLENLNREFRRRTKTQASFGTEAAALTLLYGLVAFGQIVWRRIDGREQLFAFLAKEWFRPPDGIEWSTANRSALRKLLSSKPGTEVRSTTSARIEPSQCRRASAKGKVRKVCLKTAKEATASPRVGRSGTLIFGMELQNSPVSQS